MLILPFDRVKGYEILVEYKLSSVVNQLSGKNPFLTFKEIGCSDIKAK
jgi:hypothetical protein